MQSKGSAKGDAKGDGMHARQTVEREAREERPSGAVTRMVAVVLEFVARLRPDLGARWLGAFNT